MLQRLTFLAEYSSVAVRTSTHVETCTRPTVFTWNATMACIITQGAAINIRCHLECTVSTLWHPGVICYHNIGLNCKLISNDS